MAAILVCLGPSASAAAIAPSTRAVFVARADAVCAASALTLERLRGSVDADLARYTSDDTAVTRGALAGALARFFYASWTELEQLNALPAPAAGRALLERYLIGSSLVLGLARPLVWAVSLDLGDAVLTYAREMAGYSSIADGFASSYGFLVCGRGSHFYTVSLRFPGLRRVAVGAPVAVRRGGRLSAGAGEVLSVVRSARVSSVLIALGSGAGPVARGSTASLGGGEVTLDEPARAGVPALASGSTIRGR